MEAVRKLRWIQAPMEKPLSRWKDTNATGGFIRKQGTRGPERKKENTAALASPVITPPNLE